MDNQDVQKQQMTALFTGKWVADADPIMLKRGDFSDIQNYRYTDKGIRGVSGYSKASKIVFTLRTSGLTSIGGIGYNGSTLWAITGAFGGAEKIARSSDGVVWTLADVSAIFDSGMIQGIAHNQTNLWCAVGGNGEIATSTDCITWTERTPVASYGFTRVLYGGGQWMAGGAGPAIQTSPDGITWTDQSGTINTIVADIAYNGSDLWCAVGEKIHTSPDGITWTERTPDIHWAFLMSVVFDGSLWVVGGGDGSDAVILTSPDGITWTERFPAITGTEYIYRIAYNGSNLLMSAAGEGAVEVSSDGIDWTLEDVDVLGTSTLIDLASNQSGQWIIAATDGKVATCFLPWSD